ncbi:MAG: HesA/MoeB/ThiF family protein [Bacteroidota bacterium]
METYNTASLFSRNQPFIDDETQKKLAGIKIALIGVGLSSQVALSLARAGIRRFTLWDHDVVSETNLNRQAFAGNDIGKNKAMIVAGHLQNINSDIEVSWHTNAFSSQNLDDLQGVDIAVNSADFNMPVIYKINDTMQEQGGWCIQPLNLGFGGACMIFGKDTPGLAEMTRGKQKEDAAFIQNLLNTCTGFEPGTELLAMGEKLLINSESSGWFPQNIIATLITTSLITWGVVKIVSGNTAGILAPRLLHFEPKGD